MSISRDGERGHERDGFRAFGVNPRFDSRPQIHLPRRRQRIFRTFRRLREKGEYEASKASGGYDQVEW